MTVNKARRVVNNVRKITKRNWPTPVSYVGGGVNGKVYMTNSGKLMKIALGSQPQEFRPLHTLKNTKFVPRFNQKNWAIVPIKKMNSIRNLFESTNNKKATIFLMNKVGNKVVTLHSFLESANAEMKERIRNKVKQMIKMIHERGISHGNLHTENILVNTTDSKNPKLWMIDFGRSVKIPLNMTERNMYMKKFIPTGIFNSKGLLSKRGIPTNAPLFENKNGVPRRLNAHMLLTHYGVDNYPRNIKSKR